MLSRFANARVLAVDDNEANIALLRAVLHRAGMRNVVSFTDPREAVARFDEINPDLVLLDLHMPHVDGFEVLSMIIERAAGSYLPVLVLTADATREAAHKALNLGARDFITKPFDTSEVVLRVRNLLETRTLYQAVRGHNQRLREQLDVYQSIEQSERATWQNERERVEAVLNGNGIVMHFQPIFDLHDGHVTGVEALARFSDSSLSPDRWFTLAGSVGLGPALEIAAIRSAFDVVDDMPDGLFVALNVSPGALLTPAFQDLCTDGFCSRVVLELTEHVPVEDYDAVAYALLNFRARGLKLAADDTGAGYAGFRHLLGLDPDIIKLDISLIRDIHRDPTRRALTTALVRFAEETQRTLVAEGIENADELGAIRDLSVQWGQGYHLARPMERSALENVFLRA
jgi:EAL domain-containing protein (putative c-di-GMP-specific phosphodiesterase class I)/ActR/RegA family two-component response regulator